MRPKSEIVFSVIGIVGVAAIVLGCLSLILEHFVK